MRIDHGPAADARPNGAGVENAVLRIALELQQVRQEHPDWTPRQLLQEARRRSASSMLAAVDAIEDLDRVQKRAESRRASSNDGAGLARC